MVISARSLSKSIPGIVASLSAVGLVEVGSFRSLSIYGERGTVLIESVYALPTSRRAADPADSFEELQCFAQAFVLD